MRSTFDTAESTDPQLHCVGKAATKPVQTIEMIDSTATAAAMKSMKSSVLEP
jgi:hypothetical protein